MLKRRDAAIAKIMDMAGHVVLYSFNEETKAWDRKGVEGSLFVVERTTEPRYQFVVMNRLSSENLIETVDADFQTELTDQFLLYRNLKQEILGVWFYSPGERTAISELLTSLTAGGDAPANEPPPPPVESEPAVEVTQQPASAVGESSPASGKVAQFFNMAAMSQAVGQQAPPMPPGAATASEVVPPAATATPPVPPPAAPAQPSGSAPAVRPSVDVEALKKKLAGQLRALVDDDAFLTILASEYLRQQQRALQQAQQARQKRAATAEAAATAASTPPDAAAASVPAHLASLMQQLTGV